MFPFGNGSQGLTRLEIVEQLLEDTKLVFFFLVHHSWFLLAHHGFRSCQFSWKLCLLCSRGHHIVFFLQGI
jgi:hypothetical protein